MESIKVPFPFYNFVLMIIKIWLFKKINFNQNANANANDNNNNNNFLQTSISVFQRLCGRHFTGCSQTLLMEQEQSPKEAKRQQKQEVLTEHSEDKCIAKQLYLVTFECEQKAVSA